MSDAQSPKKRGMLKFVLIPLILIVAIVVGVLVFLFQPGSISAVEAQEIAIQHVGGDVRANWPERDFEGFRRVWHVEVFEAGGRFTHNVYVSRFTGEIVRIEIDD